MAENPGQIAGREKSHTIKGKVAIKGLNEGSKDTELKKYRFKTLNVQISKLSNSGTVEGHKNNWYIVKYAEGNQILSRRLAKEQNMGGGNYITPYTTIGRTKYDRIYFNIG